MAFPLPALTPIALRVDQPAILGYAAVTDDYNPIHVDPDFAAATEMGGTIAHGTLSLNLIWQALEHTLGSDAVFNLDLVVRFRRPVRAGDQIEAGGHLADDGRSYIVWVRNQDNDEVISGTATF